MPAPSPSGAVGVITGDGGAPQCTATVVDLRNSFDLVQPAVAQELKQFQATFNDNVVVTAAHCVLGSTGIMFAPGFTGIAPFSSVDFTTGFVDSGGGEFGGSPFAGDSIGEAPLGVWGCSNESGAIPRCMGSNRDAVVVVPHQYPADNSYDYAFVVFKTAPPNESRSLLQVAGGYPIWFDPDAHHPGIVSLSSGDSLESAAYDVQWNDANRPGDTSGWFDLLTPPESMGCGATPVLKECSYKYIPFSPNAGPRRSRQSLTCSPM